MESQSQSRAKYDRSRIESYIQTREAMITTSTTMKSSKTKVPAASQQRKLEATKTEPPLKFVKLPPSKEKLFCIYLDKFQTVVHSFITEFLESQVFQMPRQAVPNNYNIKTKIKLMNYILLKFDPRSRKLLQEEVLSTMCHLICHQRKLLRSDSYRNCDFSKCNAPDLIWALKEDHTRHLDDLLRRLQSEYKAQAEAYDPESVRAQQAYMEATLIPIYTTETRPSSPRVIPAMHYKNVIQQIFHKRGCGQDHSSSSTVYTVRKDTQFPPPPFDTASLHFGKTDEGKSAKILTSLSRDKLQPSVSKSRLFFKSPPGPCGDNPDSYAYTGLFGIRSPEERKILECRVAAHLKSLGGKCGFRVRPCSAAASTYGRMIVNEITTLQNFEDSLLNYSLVSKCIPLLWCGTGPDGKPLLYPTDYKMGDCGTRIGQAVNNLALHHHLFGGLDCRRSRPRKKRKGRSFHSDSSTSASSSRRDGGGGAGGSNARSPSRARKKGKMDTKFAGKSHSTTSLSTVASTINRNTLKRANRFMKSHHKSVSASARRPSGKLRGRPRAKELANKTTSTLQGMLALEFERNNGKMSSQAHSIQTELEYRKVMAEKGEGPMESDQESRSSRGGKGKQKTSVNSGQRKFSARRSRLSFRESGMSFAPAKSCGTFCDQAAQTQDPPRPSRSNVHDKGTMGKRPSQYQYGVKEQQFRAHGGTRSSRGEILEETMMTTGHRKSGGFVPPGKVRDMARQSRITDRLAQSTHRPSMYGMKPPISKQSVSVQHKQQNPIRRSMPSHPLHKAPRNSRDAQNQSLHPRERSKSTQYSPPRSSQRSPQVNEGMLELSQARRSRQGFSSHGIQTDDRYNNRGSIGIQVRAAGDSSRRSRDESHLYGRPSNTSIRQTRASQQEKGRGSWDQNGGRGYGPRDSYKKEGRLSTFGVQTSRGGSTSQGVQTRPEWRYGGEELEMEDEGVGGDRWEMVHRFKLSHTRGTGEMFRMEMPAEDMDVEDESTSYTKRGSTIGTDPMSHPMKDAVVGSPPKLGRGVGKVTTGVGRERVFSGAKATRDKDAEVQVSDEDDRRSNSSERRWKHATFSRTLVKGPVHIGHNGLPHSHGRGGKRMTGPTHVPAVVNIGRNGSRLKLSQRTSQTLEHHTPESTLRIHMRKKTGFVKNEPNMQHRLSTLYEATTKKKSGKGSTEAQTHGHPYGARKGGLHDTDVGGGKKRHGPHSHMAHGQSHISSLSGNISRFPKLDKGLNTDQVRRDKFFESLKAPRQEGKGKQEQEEKVSSSVGPMTGSYADVSDWRNVERVAEYSKSMRTISKGKPLPWNVRPDGWDEFGKANTGRPIGFGDDDDDLNGFGLGMMDSPPDFPAPMPQQRVERRGDFLSTHPEAELAERRSSKLLPTQDKDEIIDLTIPQENFFWVPLGRYSWEVRNIKVWKSQFVPTKEKLGSSSRTIMGVLPQLKIPSVKGSNSACFDSDTQVNRAKRFVSCSDICSVCMLDSGFCQCD